MSNRAEPWVLAARPQTLPAGIAPVLIGGASAWRDNVFALVPFLVVLFAVLAIQVGVNYANDLADGQRGTDTKDRIGPLRAVATGLISPTGMMRGVAVAFGLGGLAGIYLIWYAGWPILIIGVISIIAALGYTNGPIPYGYYGLGELFVFIFFGLVATCGTRYVFGGEIPPEVWAGGVVMGLLAAAILQANNVRDIETDSQSGKRTLSVILGRERARRLYAYTLISSLLITVFGSLIGWFPPLALITIVVTPLALPLIRTISTETEGPPLIEVLKGTARLQLVVAILLSVAIIF